MSLRASMDLMSVKHFSVTYVNSLTATGLLCLMIKRLLEAQRLVLHSIQESRISIVILSKRYASSSWCLDELVEILKCKKVLGQIVMTIFYGVEPSDVRKQTGEFGIAFDETCSLKTDEERQKWSKALKDVGNIAGEDFLRWDNEANMIKKIARDVLDKLNATPSKDFDSMVGLETHLREMESLLDLDHDGVKMVAISGPAGIGKTTIARALRNRISNKFQLTCFVDNLRGNYPFGFDEYGQKLRLQEEFLSNILNQDGIKISHLGVIEERLHDKRVLIILDDVNSLKQLEALADKTTWFGSGSRIVVTTENKELLQQHGINYTYHVRFPSDVEAIEILNKYACRKSNPHDGFEKLAERITELCGKLPLGLRVVGSSLRGKKIEEWEEVLLRLETVLDRDIEDVLRVGYECLDENEQSLFLHIAVFFNYKDGDLVRTIFADGDFDVQGGLKILANRSLIDISTCEERIVMHKLLQQMARQAIRKQEPWKRQILIDANEICDVLENETGTGVVSGMLFDISRIDEVYIGKKAFRKMPNLRFLRVYKSRNNGNDRMCIPEKMDLPRRLRLLHWEAYPNKCLPRQFHPEYLVDLDMKFSKLEKLWEGIQRLTNLNKVDLSGSFYLKELPELSNATNLETLKLTGCRSLVEIPSSFSHLHKLRKLKMVGCINLELIPDHLNLRSLDSVNMEGCSKLRKFPAISTNIRTLNLSKTYVEDVPASVAMWSHLEHLDIRDNTKLKAIIDLPMNLSWLDLSCSDIEKIPDSMKALHQLQELNLSGCMRLTSLPKLPRSLNTLTADNCVSLKTICFHLKHTPDAMLSFLNNFKLSQQARREIIQGSLFCGSALLPGRQVPAEFDHRASGNSLTIPHSAFSRFKVCLVISPNLKKDKAYITSQVLCCRIYGKQTLYPIDKEFCVGEISEYRSEHLFIFHSRLLDIYMDSVNVRTEILFEFINQSEAFHVTECGAKILNQPSIEGSYESGLDQASEEDIESELSEDAFVDKTSDACTNEEVTCDYEAKILNQPSIEGSYESGLNQASEDDIELSEDAFVEETNIDDTTNEEVTCDYGAKILIQPSIEGSYESRLYQASEHDIEFEVSEDAFVEKTNIDDQTNEEVTCDCGAKILIQPSIEGSYEAGLDQASEDDIEPELSEDAFVDETNIDNHTNEEDQNLQSEKHTDCWSWLFLFFGLSHLVRNLGR